MSSKARELIQRQRAQITVMPQRNWAPEIAGLCLFTLAILSTAGVLG